MSKFNKSATSSIELLKKLNNKIFIERKKFFKYLDKNITYPMLKELEKKVSSFNVD